MGQLLIVTLGPAWKPRLALPSSPASRRFLFRFLFTLLPFWTIGWLISGMSCTANGHDIDPKAAQHHLILPKTALQYG